MQVARGGDKDAVAGEIPPFLQKKARVSSKYPIPDDAISFE